MLRHSAPRKKKPAVENPDAFLLCEVCRGGHSTAPNRVRFSFDRPPRMNGADLNLSSWLSARPAQKAGTNFVTTRKLIMK